MELPANNPVDAPALCDVLGLETDSFSRFLASKEDALQDADHNAEKRISDALLCELIWPQ